MEYCRKITALKVQKKNPNRVNIYLDGEFSFGLARIVAAWLQIGQSLTPEKMDQLKTEDALEVAYQKAIKYLDSRPRSELEVRNRLMKYGFDENITDRIIEKLHQSKLIDDTQFAKTWIENRLTFRPRGKKALWQELKQKGMSEQIIQDSLQDIQSEEEIALPIAQKYASRLNGMDWNSFRSKLYGYLGRKGFSFEIIQPLTKKIWLKKERENMEVEGENE